MPLAEMLSRVAAELALFAGFGFLLFAINDLVVDVIYFGRAMWRSVAVYTRKRDVEKLAVEGHKRMRAVG